MKFVPLYDRVLVKRVDEVNKTSGGIIIPDTAKEKPSEGIVEAVGNGGDRILFAKWSGTEVKLNGEDRLIIKESEILGVIEE